MKAAKKLLKGFVTVVSKILKRIIDRTMGVDGVLHAIINTLVPRKFHLSLIEDRL